MTDTIKVRKRQQALSDATNMSLMVESISQQTLEEFNQSHIVDALISELNFTEARAEEIAIETVEKLKVICEHADLKTISTSLIRSIVNTVLYEKGTKKELSSAHDISLSMSDITSFIEQSNNENGNLTHNPESINFSLAERFLKEYALRNIYKKDEAKAHLEGKIHLHDLGTFNRAYCSGHSVEYVKLNGIKNIPSISSTSFPASSAWTLARHICSLTQFYSGIFAGAIGWEAINVFFAPLLVGWSQKKLKQLAQTLIFDLSQLAGAKGGQTSFTDFNVYISIPLHYRETLVVGKNGKFVGHNNVGEDVYFDSREKVIAAELAGQVTAMKYKDYEKESQAFAKAILSVIEEGDAVGLPFAFPKINLHVNEDVFNSIVYVEGKGYLASKDDKHLFYKDIDLMNEAIRKDPNIIAERVENVEGRKILMAAAKAASKTGCPYFIYDRDGAGISQCCRLKITFSEDDMKLLKTPEELRFVGVQNVSINLPGCSLDVNNNEKYFYKELENRMRLAMRAHVSRTRYLEKLMKLKNTPLKFYAEGMDGKPYVDFKRGSYLIGIVGLNECVHNLIGLELHESDEAHLKGLEIISFMKMKADELGKEYQMNVKLEETPAESTASRFALLDIKKHGEYSFVKQNELGQYYTNSIHYSYDSNIDYIDRLYKQSQYHTLVDAGSMIHLWVGEKLPEVKSIYKLIEETWYNTTCVQWVISPEFTLCCNEGKVYQGLYEKCPHCGSTNVKCYTRVTGYYTNIEAWNKGKKAELKDRNKNAYQIKGVLND